MPIAKLNRSVIRISGEDAKNWLDGLISNAVTEDISFAALLTPQGKIIADFFVVPDAGALLIDVAEKYEAVLVKRLSMYKLRAPIEINVENASVYAAWNGSGDEGLPDPRHPALGRRIYGADLQAEHDQNDYDLHRLGLGVPDSQYDFETSDIFPANANMDLINGVDFKKGCFVGQEVVSRMHRKTDVKKRMRGFTGGSKDETKILQNDRVVGEVMYRRDQIGMAMIRQDRLADDNSPITIGDEETELMDLPNGNSPK